ncbi:sialate O-acetylesterase [Flavobacterium sp. HSC-61S13]|uniref:sialate O-acetylesterase n=1 Tax=Flavobacterium sp. HSC-61S13 TaxID=2910963 RepID=UPI00209F286F|nr:sialate O-acetylesterase [Flavobacterium sp. HSC-61S13]MCP1996461.1 hypothetical protein [Flavobacterium sp. HSC-61S13]
MKTIYLLFSLLLVQTVMAQSEINCLPDNEGYDVILVAGQSNTHYGYPLDTALDTVNSRIYSLNRHNGKDYRIETAQPALDFWTKQTNRNSFAITFSNLYVNNLLNHSKRKVLLIPCGYAGSSITSWTKNQNLYTDAMNRVNYILNNAPGSRLVAILWHQGEANVGWGPYQATLDQMIADMRSDIEQNNIQEIPFILGGMVPYWVNSNSSRKQQQQIIKNTPDRVINTGYADSESPSVITKPNNANDDIHFDAAGQREMGQRYFNTYIKMKAVALKLTINRYHEVEYSTSNSKLIPIDKIDIVSNKNLQTAIVYNSDNQIVLAVNNINTNSVTVHVQELPLDNQPYKLQLIDDYGFVHDYKFYR